MNGDCLNPNLLNPHPLPIAYYIYIYNTNKGTGALGNLGTPKSQNCPRVLQISII